MSWLTNFVRPKIQALVNRPQIPDDLWDKCPACEQMIFHRDLEARQNVCPHCDHHMRITPLRRFETMFDAGQFQNIELPEVAVDPLKFRDSKRYVERLRAAQVASGESDAILVAHGAIGGHQVVACGLDFSFMGGSMGMAVGEGLIAAARLAVLQRAPLIAIPSSGGARMQEGILSLMQMPRTIVAVNDVREAGLPYIAVLTNPTTGGVTASFAMLGDITIAEPGALIGFAGPRVIADTLRESLPEGFQKSEYLHDHGMVDMVVHRHELPSRLARLLDLLLVTKPSAEVVELIESSLEIPRMVTGPAESEPPAELEGPGGES
ncbi:MAG: acetyl-CoA carboxylase, carboxyltransferase subunit beta [Alphaproteobacteria bacterium]|jgi:acetyl-CoA carboxylase carboxyl transferase subunit beta|nr:acetyl-CoA carboxylase, carboxyltransferase subunit beta [Alphaproteobacteria bacterium]MDP6517180.1 acetyl-CoA carboxylase, carboxyltransferase subunit beta [Alphaproteobacteria bacterium]